MPSPARDRDERRGASRRVQGFGDVHERDGGGDGEA